MKRSLVLTVLTVLAQPIFTFPNASAAEIKLISANATRGAIAPLAAEFEKSSGHKVTMEWGTTPAVGKRIESGEVFDVVLIGSDEIDRLLAGRKLVADSRTDIARSVVGVAVRAGLPKPDISSGEAVRRAALDAKSISYASGASGILTAEMFRKMGI